MFGNPLSGQLTIGLPVGRPLIFLLLESSMGEGLSSLARYGLKNLHEEGVDGWKQIQMILCLLRPHRSKF